VEVQVGGQKKRGRFDTFDEAKLKEKEWKRAFASGSPPQGARPKSDAAGIPRTLKALSRKAEGSLWLGKAIERTRFQQLDKVVEWLGDIALEEITTAKVDDLQRMLVKRGVKPITRNKYYSCLNQLLKWAQDRDYMKGVLPSFPWEEEGEGRIREITEVEEDRLTCLLKSFGRQDLADLVTVGIETGLRRGELLKVKLEWIRDAQVTVPAAISKSKRSRTVPMTPDTTRLLRALVLSGMPAIHTLRHFWDKAKKDMGLSEDNDLVFHACRHTCCTRLIRAGVSPVVAQKWMGHQDIKTTLRYTHLNDGDVKAALAQLQQGKVRSTVVDFPRTRGSSASGTNE